MLSNLIRFRVYRIFFVFTICICSHFYAHAQVTVRDAAICAGETVDFDKLVSGALTADPVGWYIGDERKFDRYLGFTDTPAVTTVYTLRYVINGATYEHFVTVTVYQLPDLVFPGGDDVTICSGEGVTLNAVVTNNTPFTEITWIYDGFTWNNGELLKPTSIGTHTATAIARNAPECTTATKEMLITVNFNPILAKGVPSTVTHCTQKSVDLNDCIDFLVYDVYGNHDTAHSTTGAIIWYDVTYTPVPDPEHVWLTSLGDTSFYAGVSGIMASYSNSCKPSFHQPPTPTPIPVPIDITSNDFLHDYNYNNMCFGDSVYAVFQLVDDTFLNPSKCAVIKDYGMLSTHSPVRKVETTPTEWMLVFAPFTGLDDTIKVKIEGNIAGLDKEFALFLRNPLPPNISSGTVCRNTDAYFSVISDHCDTIRDVQCNIGINNTITKTDYRVWHGHVPELPDATSFQCEVAYFSKLHNAVITHTINHTLEIWADPPELSVSLLQGDFNFPLSFDNTTQNLCLGDSLLFTFSTPHNCDTIISITWLQNSGKAYEESPHIHSYIIKPTQEGSVSYRARVTYKYPKGITNINTDILYTINVKRRPQLFINPNPPDTLKYCYLDDSPLDFNTSPMKDLINYNFVDPGTEKFIIPNGGGWVDELLSFEPKVTNNYVVRANYTYLCSEMDTTLIQGEVRMIVNRKDEDPAAYIKPPPSIGFCISAGVTLYSEDKEGSSLRWLHNGNPVPPFPYPLLVGAHTFTTLISNACYPYNNPYPYDVGVEVVPLPEVTAMPDITVCRGATITLETLPNPVGTLTWTDLWGQAVSSPVQQIQESATFVVHATIAACGTAKDTVTVFRMADAAVRLMPDTSVCNGDYMRLRYEWKEGDIVWNNGHDNLTGENPSVQIIQDGTYTATVSNTCTSATATLTVTMLSLPVAKVKTDTSICHGESLDLELCQIDINGIPTWTPGAAIKLTEPTMYVVTATTKECGSAKDTMYVNVYKPLLLLPNDNNLPRYNKQDIYEVNFQTLQAEPTISYSMSGTLPPGLTMANGRISGQPALGPYDYNTHHLQVTVTDGHQCRASKEYLLTPEWKAANVVLPMGDAGNAVFLPGYNLEVYNRNGLLLHKGVGWDGKWNNAFVPAGTYFYKVMILIDNIPEERMNYVVVMYY